jgi:putative addiction module component (TIGR02574 family)
MRQLTDYFDFSGLSIDERTLLAYRLRKSVERDVEAMKLTSAQRAEIEQRIADADAGLIPSTTWPEVKRRLDTVHETPQNADAPRGR